MLEIPWFTTKPVNWWRIFITKFQNSYSFRSLFQIVLFCNWIYWSLKKIGILQTTFSDVFYWMKIIVFCLKFHSSLFPGVQMTISQHWCIMACHQTGAKPFTWTNVDQVLWRHELIYLSLKYFFSGGATRSMQGWRWSLEQPASLQTSGDRTVLGSRCKGRQKNIIEIDLISTKKNWIINFQFS